MSVSRTLKTDLYYNNTHKNTIIVVSCQEIYNSMCEWATGRLLLYTQRHC